MLSDTQKRIVSDFFDHTIDDGEGTRIIKDIPHLDMIDYITFYRDKDVMQISQPGVGVFFLEDFTDEEISSLISFFQEMNHVYTSVMQHCTTALAHDVFTLSFDWLTDKQTRVFLTDNCSHCDYDQQYASLRKFLIPLGYTIKRDSTDSSVFFVIKYTPEYLAKGMFGKLLYNIIHWGY